MVTRLKTYLPLLQEKWKDKKERRQILAFTAVSLFALFSFWRSFSAERLQSDITKASVVETLSSGEITSDHPRSNSTMIVDALIDESGSPREVKNGKDLPEDVVRSVMSMKFTPIQKDGKPIAAIVPVVVYLNTDNAESAGAQAAGSLEKVEADKKHE